MRKSFLVITSLILIASFSFGETVVSVVGSSAENGVAIASVAINLENTIAVGGLQFSLKDIPNELSVFTVIPKGRCAAEVFTDTDNNGIWTPGEPLEDTNGNTIWDGPFDVQFNDRDSTVSILIYDGGGNAVVPGNGEICEILFNLPGTVSDEIIELKFHEILDADPQFLLVVTDPDGTALNTTWLNGLLTIGGIEVRFASGGGGSPSYLSEPLVIEMNNAVPVKGIQFNIVDGIDYLQLESVIGLDRAANFTFVGHEVNGQSMVLGVNFNGEEIQPGSGAIVEITFMISPSASLGELPISFSNLIVAAEGGLPLPSNGADGVITVATGVDDQAELPTSFGLDQNYPNPFNPTTTIAYRVPEASDIQLGIYNLLGQEIRSLVVGDHQPGFYTTMWDGLNQNGIRVESGVYIYRMTSTEGFSATKKLVLLK
ncbi:MAG: T9SS type A sorting domain-containing protein [Candidatus Marinimicrobia bacterium]|nr:T9SS type A sorting domain-containing protein [Candidatus Neomarinimicrobiota bacterium]